MDSKDKEESKLEKARRSGSTQVEERRRSILQAAEGLFLSQGLESASMSKIASLAGITRVSLYRYFPDLEWIAAEVNLKLLGKLSAGNQNRMSTFDDFIETLSAMIDGFFENKAIFRYMASYDSLYTDSSRAPDSPLTVWYGKGLAELGWDSVAADGAARGIEPDKIAMLANAVMSFLKALAVRGGLMAGEQGADMKRELLFFKEMILREAGRVG